jgi:hypothetical protein
LNDLGTQLILLLLQCLLLGEEGIYVVLESDYLFELMGSVGGESGRIGAQAQQVRVPLLVLQHLLPLAEALRHLQQFELPVLAA